MHPIIEGARDPRGLSHLQLVLHNRLPRTRHPYARCRSERPGENDLRELNRTFPALADVAATTKERSVDFGGGAKPVGEGRGAFPELAEALKGSAPIIAHGRPYTPDLFGWFDDFSHTGAYDALGSFSRVQTYINAFSVEAGIPTNLIPLADRTSFFRNQARLRQVKRCPGGAEIKAADGSNVLSAEEQAELDCREADRATGDY